MRKSILLFMMATLVFFLTGCADIFIHIKTDGKGNLLYEEYELLSQESAFGTELSRHVSRLYEGFSEDQKQCVTVTFYRREAPFGGKIYIDHHKASILGISFEDKKRFFDELSHGIVNSVEFVTYHLSPSDPNQDPLEQMFSQMYSATGFLSITTSMPGREDHQFGCGLDEVSQKGISYTVYSDIEYKEPTPMILWEQTYGGSQDDRANSIIQTTDGGYVVAGYTSSKGAGGFDAWILKLDNQGNLLWDRTYGGSQDDRANSIIQTTDGGYVVAGYTSSKGAGEVDAWIIRLDREGNKVWDRTYGGSHSDRANSLIQTTDGGYVVAGGTYSKGAGEVDAWIIRLDREGNKVWDRTYGGSHSDRANSLIQTADDSYAVAGFTSSKGAGGYDAWIIKLDSQGNQMWNRTYGGSRADMASSLIQTTDGGYAVAGYTSSKGAGGFDAWILKLDNQGNLLWDRTYGGSQDDGANSIIQTTDGGYAVAGVTWSKGAGGLDAWIFKIEDQVNLISEKDDSETGISQPSLSTHPLQGSLHCPDTTGYACLSCLEAPGYVNHFKGFNILTTQEDCYVRLVTQDNSSMGNHNDCEVIIKGEKWLGLEDESGTILYKEINKGNFDFIPANLFAERTMTFPQDHYQYEFADGGREFRLYLSRNLTEAFKAVPWRPLSVEIKNQKTNKVFTYQFEKGIFPRPYTWSTGVANYGQCVWWAAKRWVEEVDFQNLFPFYPSSPQTANVKIIDLNYKPKQFDILIDYIPGGQPGHYAFVEKIEDDLLYISQFNFIPPGEVYNSISRFWNGNPKSLYYSLNPSNEYYFKYYYRK